MLSSPSKPATPTRCRCGVTVLVGLDDGVPVRAEATPTAEPTGLAYVMTARGYLVWRNPDQHEQPTGPVHRDHQCRTTRPPATESEPTLF